MKKSDWMIYAAGLLASGSVISHAAYLIDGLADEFPYFLLGAIGVAVFVQAFVTAGLVLERSLRSWIAFLVVACAVGLAEVMTYSGALFVRDFMSSAAALVAFVGTCYAWTESGETPETH